MDLRSTDVLALGQLLNDRAGLKLAADGEFGLSMAMKGRMQALKMQHSSQYLAYLRGADQDVELHRLLPLVTVGKTDFFRDARQFEALAQRLIPEALARARHERRPMHLWSAACATGEEPYSMGMVAIECGALVQEVSLRATDINAEAVFEAERGVYSLRKLRPVSNERLKHFFISEGFDAAKVTPELRKIVRFGQLNLAEGSYDVPAGGFDIIFCRNVLIYFDSLNLVRTLERIYESLVPGGILALGYSESLYRIYNRFELTEIEGAFFYRRPAAARPKPAPAPSRPLTPPLIPRVPPTRPRTTQLFEPLPDAAQPRKPEPEPVLAPVPTVAPDAPHRLARGIELMERGQFLESLDLLRVLVQAEPESLTGWITLGNLLTVLRRFPEANAAYERALQVEPLSAEARLFSGVAQVEAGRSKDAIQELGRALFLDSELALAHYYLARAQESLGDHAAAKRAYKNCLTLCQSGNPARPFLAHYPDLPKDPEVLGRAAQYALSALR